MTTYAERNAIDEHRQREPEERRICVVCERKTTEDDAPCKECGEDVCPSCAEERGGLCRNCRMLYLKRFAKKMREKP